MSDQKSVAFLVPTHHHLAPERQGEPSDQRADKARNEMRGDPLRPKS